MNFIANSFIELISEKLLLDPMKKPSSALTEIKQFANSKKSINKNGETLVVNWVLASSPYTILVQFKIRKTVYCHPSLIITYSITRVKYAFSEAVYFKGLSGCTVKSFFNG
jgi:hypothetical protein